MRGWSGGGGFQDKEMFVPVVEPLDEGCEDGRGNVRDGEGFPLAWWWVREGVEEAGEVGGEGEEEVGMDVEEGGGEGGRGGVGGGSRNRGWGDGDEEDGDVFHASVTGERLAKLYTIWGMRNG